MAQEAHSEKAPIEFFADDAPMSARLAVRPFGARRRPDGDPHPDLKPATPS